MSTFVRKKAKYLALNMLSFFTPIDTQLEVQEHQNVTEANEKNITANIWQHEG